MPKDLSLAFLYLIPSHLFVLVVMAAPGLLQTPPGISLSIVVLFILFAPLVAGGLCMWCRNWLVYAPLCVLGTYALKHWAGYLWFDVWYPDADPGPAGVIFGYPEYVATISLCAFGCIRLLMGFWKKRPAQ